MNETIGRSGVPVGILTLDRLEEHYNTEWQSTKDH